MPGKNLSSQMLAIWLHWFAPRHTLWKQQTDGPKKIYQHSTFLSPYTGASNCYPLAVTTLSSSPHPTFTVFAKFRLFSGNLTMMLIPIQTASPASGSPSGFSGAFGDTNSAAALISSHNATNPWTPPINSRSSFVTDTRPDTPDIQTSLLPRDRHNAFPKGVEENLQDYTLKYISHTKI